MNQNFISYGLISLSISILGLSACSSTDMISTTSPSNSGVTSNNSSTNSNTSITRSESAITEANSKVSQTVNKDEFDKIKQSPSFTLFNATEIKREEEQRNIEFNENKNAVDNYSKTNSELSELIFNEPLASDSNIKPLNDGNYLLKVKNSTGGEQDVITLGNRFKINAIANTIKTFPTYENQLDIYKSIYDSLPENEKESSNQTLSLKANVIRTTPTPTPRIIYRETIDDKFVTNPERVTIPDRSNDDINIGGTPSPTPTPMIRNTNLFPKPENIARLSANEIKEYNVKLSNRIYEMIRVKFLDPNIPSGYVSNPANEEGSGTGNDRTNSSNTSCTTPRENGIYKNFNWTNKYFVTSVKNQGSRGTCVAFAITSADEMKIAKNNKKWVNLSEQDYYYKNKAVWWPSTFGDGLDTLLTWKKLNTTGYKLPYENDWNYNPSYSRVANDDNQTYKNSCNGYGEECSDTNHQGKQICIDLPTGKICGSLPGGNSAHPYNITGTIQEIWNFDNKDLSVSLTAINLALGRSVVISSEVTPSFDSPDANGYAHYIGSKEISRGGHALHVSGFISNEVLAKKLPSAPAGSGGGYFIVKNSWGSCFADAGYIYLPFDWVKKYTYSMTVRY